MNTSAPIETLGKSPEWRRISVIVLLVALAGAFWLWKYQRAGPRRSALSSLESLSRNLGGSDTPRLLESVSLPAVIVDRTPAEQARWLAEILRDEISPEGLAELQRHGRFGPLAEVFPDEAKRWAEAAHLPVESCVAFRMEREILPGRDSGGRDLSGCAHAGREFHEHAERHHLNVAEILCPARLLQAALLAHSR